MMIRAPLFAVLALASPAMAAEHEIIARDMAFGCRALEVAKRYSSGTGSLMGFDHTKFDRDECHIFGAGELVNVVERAGRMACIVQVHDAGKCYWINSAWFLYAITKACRSNCCVSACPPIGPASSNPASHPPGSEARGAEKLGQAKLARHSNSISEPRYSRRTGPRPQACDFCRVQISGVLP
jgi:hypothetical protein